MDLFEEPTEINKRNNLINSKRKLYKIDKKNKGKSMHNILKKLGKDGFYFDKIHAEDKNKMFFDHFKNTIPIFNDEN